MKNLIFLLLIFWIVGANGVDYFYDEYVNDLDYYNEDYLKDLDYYDEDYFNDIDYFEEDNDRSLRRRFRTDRRVCPNNKICANNNDCDWYVVMSEQVATI